MDNLGPLDKLIAELGKLPGIGPKSASRLAFFLLKHPYNEAVALAEAIVELKKQMHHCSTCFNITATDPCEICSDHKRDRSTILVLEHPQDLLAIEATAEYRGLYHVLMGALSPINGIGPEDITITQLKERLEKNPGETSEIVIATNPTHDGEATAVFLVEELQGFDIKISRIAQGMPVGSSLQHVDEVTLARSIHKRHLL